LIEHQFEQYDKKVSPVRTSKALKVACGVLGLSALLFAVPSTASASYCETDECRYFYYTNKGYAYDKEQGVPPPLAGAAYFHVQVRNGHSHTIEFKSYGPDGTTVVDDNTVKADSYWDFGYSWGGVNAWYDPKKVSKVEVSISGKPALTDKTDAYHCYYEDKHGNLQRANQCDNT
jgi:hypothetical protein